MSYTINTDPNPTEGFTGLGQSYERYALKRNNPIYLYSPGYLERLPSGSYLYNCQSSELISTSSFITNWWNLIDFSDAYLEINNLTTTTFLTHYTAGSSLSGSTLSMAIFRYNTGTRSVEMYATSSPTSQIVSFQLLLIPQNTASSVQALHSSVPLKEKTSLNPEGSFKNSFKPFNLRNDHVLHT